MARGFELGAAGPGMIRGFEAGAYTDPEGDARDWMGGPDWMDGARDSISLSIWGMRVGVGGVICGQELGIRKVRWVACELGLGIG